MAARAAVITAVTVPVRCRCAGPCMVWWIGMFVGMPVVWAVGDMRLLGFLTLNGWRGSFSCCVVVGVCFVVFMVTYRPLRVWRR